jgi:hypothetical protein
MTGASKKSANIEAAGTRRLRIPQTIPAAADTAEATKIVRATVMLSVGCGGNKKIVGGNAKATTPGWSQNCIFPREAFLFMGSFQERHRAGYGF